MEPTPAASSQQRTWTGDVAVQNQSSPALSGAMQPAAQPIESTTDVSSNTLSSQQQSPSGNQRQYNPPPALQHGHFVGNAHAGARASVSLGSLPTQQQADQMAAQLPSLFSNVSVMDQGYSQRPGFDRTRQPVPEHASSSWPMHQRYQQHLPPPPPPPPQQPQHRNPPYNYGSPYQNVPSLHPPHQYSNHYYNVHPSLQYHIDAGSQMHNFQPQGLVMSLSAPYASMASSSQLLDHQLGPQSPRSHIMSTPRGPPRKPRQSGYALWVGNLPPNAKIEDLKEHFSIGATKDIESIKLISKSNCAFVNYRTEQACSNALERFHEMKFQGTRLVCRLRRRLSTAAAAEESQPAERTAEQNVETDEVGSQAETTKVPAATTKEHVPERYYVLKSLTLQDLELSSQTGVWATQTHNEAELNAAYKATDNVYLIFSANKSGEYFGYARMSSPIDPAITADLLPPTTAASTLPIPQSGVPADSDAVPTSLITPATEWAPKGYIIDDSTRGTIFWEADRERTSPDPTTSAESSTPENITAQPTIVTSTGSPAADAPSSSATKAASPADQSNSSHGTPFRVQWISLQRLPFYRVRGLRNPYNQNREVKIARDGTEIEPSVGQKLVSLFHAGYPVHMS